MEHRNVETRKTLTTSLFRYETFYYLWVQRFFDIRRERHNLSILAFSSAPRLVRQLPKASAIKWKSTVSFGVQSSTLLTFFRFLKSSARIRCVTSFALCNPVSHLGLLWHLWVTHPLRVCARVNTCVNVASK